ncbi:tryptophan synthase subunit alpha [Desmospora profundinema]|uniref:Tryptophan synthase alpha chain n=1 Tax=Desmospora profundinema TaxID=1571184 RepID=A0ABU1IJC0_9BACL|nr:tryptophan synthase subunit alpha [Desmospora profundinema]MDR6224493.1 tryptophan synthase alpha chain [Desmospora profundinema]
MNRIDHAFQRESRGHRLIPFITAGDPNKETTLDLIRLLDAEGVTAIELGVPYSDPLADGPVIQAASDRALAGGMTLAGVLELAREARQDGVQTPLILFTYYNPVLRWGPASLVKAAFDAGFDGFIIPDLPLEESGELDRIAQEAGLHLIPLVAPTSRERIRAIVSTRRGGFIYCVSSLGTTGMRREFADGIESFLDEVRRQSTVPVAVGFGISHPDHVKRMTEHADAAVVGSALVKRVESLGERLKQSESRPQALDEVRRFIRELSGRDVPATSGK